jgi:hypothetical protein
VAGGVRFLPVLGDSLEFYLGAVWGFPAFAIALGCSYFQRLLSALPHLASAAARCPAFAPYCCALPGGGPAAEAAAAAAAAGAEAARASYLPGHSADPCHPYGHHQQQQQHPWTGPSGPGGSGGGGLYQPVPAAGGGRVGDLEIGLRSAQFTCIYLATKVADQPHAFGLLRFVLSAITGQRRAVSLQEAAEVELRCLAGLGWRLGPFFAEDGLPDGPDDIARLFCWA